jgi:hypothetical protein
VRVVRHGEAEVRIYYYYGDWGNELLQEI